MNSGNAPIAASEILKFAVRLEKNGEKFYRKVADASEDEKVKELFAFLAEEEAKHRKTFEGMLSEVGKYEPPESYPGGYSEYLMAVADAFLSPLVADKRLSPKVDAITAINRGIRLELDSITYYHEIRRFVPETEQNSVDEIIAEEREHFLQFSKLKKTL